MSNPRFKTNEFEVWSTGTEGWERVLLDRSELLDLREVHTKNVNEIPYVFYKDRLGRWFRAQR